MVKVENKETLRFPDKDQPVCGSSGQNNLPVQERLPDCKI